MSGSPSADVPVSVWLEAVRSDLHREIVERGGIFLTQGPALAFTETLGEIAQAMRIVEARAAQAPELDAYANVVALIPPRRQPPTGGGAA